METNSSYSAEKALADVLDTRARTTEATNVPVRAWWYLPLAAVFPLSGLGFVLDSPWSYLVMVVAILIAAAVSICLAVLMQRAGVQTKLRVEPRRYPVTYAVTLAVTVAFGATLPLTDIFGWNPWVVPAAGLACGLVWAVALARLDRVTPAGSSERTAARAARAGGSR